MLAKYNENGIKKLQNVRKTRKKLGKKNWGAEEVLIK